MAFAETFKALSDPVRRQILELLKKGSLSAGDIASHLEKNYIYYQLNTSVLEEIMLWISTLKGGDSDAESK